jgi:hypothetical protein
MKKQTIYEIEDCGCNGPKLILTESKAPITLSEGLQYHITEGRMLVHNIYRPLSENYFNLFREARELYEAGLLSVTEDDAELLESNIGEYAFYNNVKVPLDYPISLDELVQLHEELELEEAKDKKQPALGKPKRGGSKKFYVYVKDPKTKRIKKVSFGDTTGLRAKLNNPKARQAFSKRHNCPQKKDRTKASYWSCRLPRYAKLLGFKTTFSGYW